MLLEHCFERILALGWAIDAEFWANREALFLISVLAILEP